MKRLNTQQRLNKCTFPAASFKRRTLAGRERKLFSKSLSDNPAWKPDFWPRGGGSRCGVRRQGSGGCPGPCTVLARVDRTKTGTEDQRAGVMTAATSLTTSFPVPIRPGPLLPGVQVGLPGRLWRDRWDASILAPDLGSRYPPGSLRQGHRGQPTSNPAWGHLMHSPAS